MICAENIWLSLGFQQRYPSSALAGRLAAIAVKLMV
jgi:hypothetical protein